MKSHDIPQRSEITIEDLFLAIFVLVDDFFKLNFHNSNISRRSNCPPPEFTDSEVVTIQIVGELLSQNSQRAWLNLVRKNWLFLFHKLPERSRFGRRLRKLQFVFSMLQSYMGFQTDANLESYYIVDSFPLTLCHLQRLKSSKLPFEYFANIGYNASKKAYYYGIKVHLATDLRGIPRFVFLTPANVSDAAALQMMAEEIQLTNHSGLAATLIGDKGYVINQKSRGSLREQGIEVLAIKRNYAKEETESAINVLLRKSRKIIETTISLLVDQFNMAKTRTRSIAGLVTSIWSKIVAFTSCCLRNIIENKPFLQIKSIAF
jgi:hypothetical protein